MCCLLCNDFYCFLEDVLLNLGTYIAWCLGDALFIFWTTTFSIFWWIVFDFWQKIVAEFPANILLDLMGSCHFTFGRNNLCFWEKIELLVKIILFDFAEMICLTFGKWFGKWFFDFWEIICLTFGRWFGRWFFWLLGDDLGDDFLVFFW